ncbi:Putative xyloglucan endotransglucosylase/hydrolase protein 21 [Glycine soja]|nr:Putative xyloglucan endotransglucosylase/hydrolase protein 21 [Glycine soja]
MQLRSKGSFWDELDFEFLGNLNGDPDTVHTNLYTHKKKVTDPTTDFRTYSFLWNPALVVFYVDGRPIREFKKLEGVGVEYPKNQSMKLYTSKWNVDDWAKERRASED